MKILHLSSALTWRGGEQQLNYLCEELQKDNIAQLVACPHNSELFERLKGSQIKTYPYKKLSGLNILFALNLKKLCKKEGVSIIHVHDSHAHTAAYLAALMGNKVPLVVSRRVDFVVGNSILSKNKYKHKSISRIICVSDAIKNIMIETTGHSDKICTVHSGIDTLRFPFTQKTGRLYNLLNIDSTSLLIGNTSALADHKDYFTFIDVAHEVLKTLPHARFIIIGEGLLKEEIKGYINKLGLQKQISMIGFRGDIPELLPDFDVFLITSKTEGLGTSILDAFACRVPVVATNAGGIPEIVKHNETGLLAPVRDIKLLTENVVKVLSDSALTELLVNNASKALKSFTKEVMAQKTMQIYSDIISKS